MFCKRRLQSKYRIVRRFKLLAQFAAERQVPGLVVVKNRGIHLIASKGSVRFDGSLRPDQSSSNRLYFVGGPLPDPTVAGCVRVNPSANTAPAMRLLRWYVRSSDRARARARATYFNGNLPFLGAEAQPSPRQQILRSVIASSLDDAVARWSLSTSVGYIRHVDRGEGRGKNRDANLIDARQLEDFYCALCFTAFVADRYQQFRTPVSSRC